MKFKHSSTNQEPTKQTEGFRMNISERTSTDLLKAIVILVLIFAQLHGVKVEPESQIPALPDQEILP